jgi:hypothetical protein
LEEHLDFGPRSFAVQKRRSVKRKAPLGDRLANEAKRLRDKPGSYLKRDRAKIASEGRARLKQLRISANG